METSMSENFEVRDLRAKERFFMDDAFFNGYVKILGTNALGVYCSLCRHADKQQKCFPSEDKIAEELSISNPTVIGCINVLEYFRIIKKKRVGKQCTNRYYLMDKKYWRKDWEVILTELNSGEDNLNNFRNKPSLLQKLTQLTSKRKETQEKGNTIERNDNSISENINNAEAEDALEYFSLATKRVKGFRPKIERKRDLGYITKFMEDSAKGASYRAFYGEDIKRMIDFFLAHNEEFKESYISIPNIICEDVFHSWQAKDGNEVIRRLETSKD